MSHALGGSKVHPTRVKYRGRAKFLNLFIYFVNFLEQEIQKLN